MASGLKRAMKTYPGASFFQIITILRDLGPEEALVMARLACKFKMDKLIVGVDLAGNEYDHPPEKFVDAFDLVFKNNLGITIHAGEGRTKQAEKNIIASSCSSLHRVGTLASSSHGELPDCVICVLCGFSSTKDPSPSRNSGEDTLPLSVSDCFPSAFGVRGRRRPTGVQN